MRELLGLDAAHTGAFVTGAMMSNFVGLAIAREWAGRLHEVSVAQQGTAAVESLTVLSGPAHASVGKALSMLGIGRERLPTVATLPGGETADVERLQAELDALDGAATVVVANAGTVNRVDFDDLRAIAALRRQQVLAARRCGVRRVRCSFPGHGELGGRSPGGRLDPGAARHVGHHSSSQSARSLIRCRRLARSPTSRCRSGQTASGGPGGPPPEARQGPVSALEIRKANEVRQRVHSASTRWTTAVFRPQQPYSPYCGRDLALNHRCSVGSRPGWRFR